MFPHTFFLNFHRPFKKGEELETISTHLKIYKTIFACFCVFPLEHFDIFWMFLLLFAIFNIYGFFKTFPLFYDQIKHKGGNRLYSLTKNNKPWKLFKPNKREGLLSFWEFKILGWFTHIVYKKTRFRISCVWHEFILRTIQT